MICFGDFATAFTESACADHRVSLKIFRTMPLGPKEVTKTFQRCVEAEKNVYNFCTKSKKETTAPQHWTAFSPTKFNECAAHGMYSASGFNCLSFACKPAYTPLILLALSYD
eukprot:Pompholyxophrys_punicea_v1_NODE_315_length_2279_cov_2.255845.p2 type:complete len:112 gc:universal NODE_315_length_2279_cov_2.255845:1767-1432(-)